MKPAAFDFESYLIAPGRLAPRPVCLTHRVEDERPDLLTPAAGLDWLEDQPPDPASLLAGANTAYDIGVALEARPALLEIVVDAYEADRVVAVQII